MVLSDQIKNWDQHAEGVLRRIVRAWEGDVTNGVKEVNKDAKCASLKVEIGGREEGT